MTANVEAPHLGDLRRQRLAALAIQLRVHKFVVKPEADRLVVRHPDVSELADTITCRPRPDDAMRLWFFTSWQEPIADANLPMDAMTSIKGYLVVRP